MRQAACNPSLKALCGLARSISSTTPAFEEAAAARNFLSWLPGAPSRHSTPLSQPLPGLDLAEKPYRPPKELITELTTLPNGARIASEATSGPTCSMGIYVNSGSIYETPQTTGASALLEALAFQSSRHRDSFQIMKEIELIGANIIANASREQMSYNIDGLKIHMKPCLEILCDVVQNPQFVPEHIEDGKNRFAALLRQKDIELTLLAELLVRSAYSGALGNPLIPDPENMNHLTPEVMRSFVRQMYTGPRTVLTAAGVPHAALVEAAAPMLSQLPADPGPDEPPSEYVGAGLQIPGSHEKANAILAFEYSGGWRDVRGAVVMTVLTCLLGGGKSFSSGGPGKGMHSRVYTRVLNAHSWVDSCMAFNSTFNDTGLVGLQASCEPSHISRMLDVMCHELEEVTRPVRERELSRARRATLALVHNALESKATSSEDIGRQMLTYGKRISAAEYTELVNSITTDDIASFAQRLLQSRPSLALFGDNTSSVNYDTLLRRYQGVGSYLRNVMRKAK